MRGKLFRYNNQQQISSVPKQPIAYQNEIYRLTQLKAYELAQADNFEQSAQHYWLKAEQGMHLGF